MMARDVARRIGSQMVATGRFPRVVVSENVATHSIWIDARDKDGCDWVVRGMDDWIQIQEQMGWPR
jgi:hypothetical protein